MNLRRGSGYGQVRGTVGSGLTPGSRPDGHTPVNSGIQLENPFSARFALIWPNQGTYRHGRGTYKSGLT